MTCKTIAIFITTLCLTSCADLHRAYEEGVAMTAFAGIIPKHEVGRTGNWILHQDTSFYVAVSGRTNLDTVVPIPSQKTEERVHNAVSELLADEISLRFPRVMRASGPQSMFEARLSAIGSGLDYIVYPRVLVWQDTAGTWSEIADALRYQHKASVEDGFGLDRTRLQLTLMESGSGRIMDVIQIESRAGIMSLYEETPQRLLVAAVGRYVDSLLP